MKCEKCCRQLYEPVTRNMPIGSRSWRTQPSSKSEQSLPQTDPCPTEFHLRQVVVGLSKRFGMTIAMYGPGSADECFAEVCRVAPAFFRTMAVEVGLGFINGDPTSPWSMRTGPSGSALLYFGHPDADSEWAFNNVMTPLLRELRSPWRASVRSMDGHWDAPATAVINQATDSVPIWKLEALEHTRPATLAGPVWPAGTDEFAVGVDVRAGKRHVVHATTATPAALALSLPAMDAEAAALEDADSEPAQLEA